MTSLLEWLLLALAVFGSGIFSGSETGLYSVSRARLDLEAAHGSRPARLLKRFLERDASILITILIGNTLMLEVATWVVEHKLQRSEVHGLGRDLVLTCLFTPMIFFLGEALPKDLFRRRPHPLMSRTAPIIALAAVLFWPLERILRLVTLGIERGLRLKSSRLSLRPGRARLLALLQEGTHVGALEPHAEELAKNAMALREIPVSRAMLPWAEVRQLDADQDWPDLRRTVEESLHTRLPICRGGRVVGYLHQLELLCAEDAATLEELQHPIQHLDAELGVDRALAKLRNAGHRLAVVGPPEAPVGLVTLKDLLEEISGDLGGW